jgi:hypothetical protein
LHLADAATSDDIDPELLTLPEPTRRERTLTILLLLVGALAALAMAGALRRDVAYALSRTTPESLGNLGEVGPGRLEASENGFVRAEGLLGAAAGLRYGRPFREDTFRALPVLGRENLWVEVRIPPSQESGRWEPPRSFAGRLESFDAVGPTHRGLRAAIERETRAHVPKDSWLLVDGEEPSHSRWAVLLAAAFLGLAVCNALAIGRIVRKVA